MKTFKEITEEVVRSTKIVKAAPGVYVVVNRGQQWLVVNKRSLGDIDPSYKSSFDEKQLKLYGWGATCLTEEQSEHYNSSKKLVIRDIESDE